MSYGPRGCKRPNKEVGYGKDAESQKMMAKNRENMLATLKAERAAKEKEERK